MKIAFTFQDMYVGLSPYGAPAIYSLLQYTELADGVWFPMGGMYRLEVVYPFSPSLVYIDRAGTQFVA
ncbi:MAG: hypothetical protein GWN67_12510 [Phycisphaerae bacterium]|nr:hypothetical protein [Phycisphaerae bacterium]NIW94348.1 hypothetical protein [Phycisphaerae bacterium]